MDILEKYSVIHNYGADFTKTPPFIQKEVTGFKLLSDAKLITLSEIKPNTRETITAHKIQNYRRTTFSLLLLPETTLILDDILQEGGDLSEFLQFKSKNTNGG